MAVLQVIAGVPGDVPFMPGAKLDVPLAACGMFKSGSVF